MQNSKSVRLRPFLSFYGSKWRLAKHYPEPRFDTIIEPFAGGAGYSTWHHTKNVILIEKDPKIASVWDYLIHVTSDEMLSLPDITDGKTVDDLSIPQEAKYLIGWWIQGAVSSPRKSASSWMKNAGPNPTRFWGEIVRRRLSEQVEQIRHWKIVLGSYEDYPDIPATWFIDPPYQKMGKHYRYCKIDYNKLAEWAMSRSGQVVVCENSGADWLPFVPFRDSLSSQARTPGRKYSKEVIFGRE